MVAVDLFHLGRPFPPLVGEVEAIPAHALRRAAGKRLLKSGEALKRAVVVGFVFASPVNLRHSISTRASQSDVSLISPARHVQPVRRNLSRNQRLHTSAATKPRRRPAKHSNRGRWRWGERWLVNARAWILTATINRRSTQPRRSRLSRTSLRAVSPPHKSTRRSPRRPSAPPWMALCRRRTRRALWPPWSARCA